MAIGLDGHNRRSVVVDHVLALDTLRLLKPRCQLSLSFKAAPICRHEA